MRRVITPRVGTVNTAEPLDNIVFVKIGTASILRRSRLRSRDVIDWRVLSGLARDITAHWGKETAFGDNTKFVVVTSGARERGRLTDYDDPRIAAGRGQPKITAAYIACFGIWNAIGRLHGRRPVHILQLLVESNHMHDDPETGVSSVSIRALKENTMVVMNENDPLATRQTTWGDNDRLVADAAEMLNMRRGVNVKAVVLMSRKNGNGNGKSVGRGGIASKAESVKKVEGAGMLALVVDGKTKRILRKLLRDEGTAIEDAISAAGEVKGAP